jgi:hypothetical protein
LAMETSFWYCGVTHPSLLQRCEAELKKAEASGSPRALWHLVQAVHILVQYLRVKEMG